jgi:hypothetical protein
MLAIYEVSSGVNKRGSPLRYISRAIHDRNAIEANRPSDLLGLNFICLIKAIIERGSVRINTARE